MLDVNIWLIRMGLSFFITKLVVVGISMYLLLLSVCVSLRLLLKVRVVLSLWARMC